jgi:hypothetical protein
MEADHELSDIAWHIAVRGPTSQVRRDRLFHQAHLTIG